MQRAARTCHTGSCFGSVHHVPTPTTHAPFAVRLPVPHTCHTTCLRMTPHAHLPSAFHTTSPRRVRVLAVVTRFWFAAILPSMPSAHHTYVSHRYHLPYHHCCTIINTVLRRHMSRLLDILAAPRRPVPATTDGALRSVNRVASALPRRTAMPACAARLPPTWPRSFHLRRVPAPPLPCRGSGAYLPTRPYATVSPPFAFAGREPR